MIMPIPFFDPIMIKSQNYSQNRAPFSTKKDKTSVCHTR